MSRKGPLDPRNGVLRKQKLFACVALGAKGAFQTVYVCSLQGIFEVSDVVLATGRGPVSKYTLDLRHNEVILKPISK